MWPMDWISVAAAKPKQRAVWKTWYGPEVQRSAAPNPKKMKNMVPKNSANTARQNIIERNSHIMIYEIQLK